MLDVIKDPTFPAIIIEIRVGANSKITDCLVANPIRFPGRKGLSILRAVWIATTPPTKKDMKATIQIEPIMRSSISWTINFFKTFHLVNFVKVYLIIKKYLPIWKKSFIMIKSYRL